MVTQDLVKKLKDGLYDAKLKDIYVDEKKIQNILEREKSLSLVHRAEVKLAGIIQIINVERCWRRPSTMMRLLLCRN